MDNIGSVLRLSAFLSVVAIAPGCKKEAGAAEGSPSPSATAAAPSAAANTALAPASAEGATPAVDGAPLNGLDTCLVGQWKGKGFSLKADPVTAEGGANLALTIAANGDSVLDFGPMAPVLGKGAGADFDFQYTGKATATLSTPARGAVTSANPNYSGLRVTANVQLPGAGKFPILKNKPVSELAEMASAITGAKAAPKAAAAGAAPPPGIDSSPVFSTSRYSCEGDTLTLSADKPAAQWAFTRVSR